MKRTFVSIVLFFDMILLAVTGIVAVFDNLIGERAEFVVKLTHFIAGLVFIVFAVYHIIYNWKALKSYLKKKSQTLPVITDNYHIENKYAISSNIPAFLTLYG